MPESSSTGSDLVPDGAQATGFGGPAGAGSGPAVGTATADRPDPAQPDVRPEVVWRLRRAAVCVLLGALAFAQDPGMTAIDTKVDLAVNPLGWMVRSLHVWDPAGTFGQLQNQAYGYLWPMGPFFAAGDLLGVPAWAVQRLWWAVLMSVAFLGLVRLADRLHLGTPVSRLIAGVAFALSPRLMTELGPISVEAWPSAVAPWVLVPLVGLARKPAEGERPASVRRAVALSALAVACAGGVNATAVLAVVPLAVLWICTLRPLRRRVRMLAAWGAAVAAATAWWLLPLLLLGRYSPPFLDYIETAEVTTRPTDPVSILRGTSHWHAYLTGAYGPLWTAGWRLITESPLVLATLVVAGFGVAGLARRGMPHRRFLVTGLLAGLALVGFGHVAAGPLGGAVTGGGLFAELQHAFLDGAGAPLRNVHKFDVVLRIPLILGLAHLLGLVGRAATVTAGPLRPVLRPTVRPAGEPGPPQIPALSLVRLRAVLVTGVALAGIAGVAAPALTGGLTAPGSYLNVPGYWRDAAAWLDQHLDDERVLVVPAARFPRYLWGSPSDEIAQPLLDSAWGVRSSIPLTPTMTIRLLDSVESVVATGQGSAGLAQVLSRSGVRYLLVRSDLRYGQANAARPLAVRQALARSPGIRRVASFGPTVGGGFLPGTYSDRGLDVAVPALEVYEVGSGTRPVEAYDVSDVTTVVGGPESLMDLAAAGRLTGAPTLLAADRPEGWPIGGDVTVTDGLRRRETSFGLLKDNASATMGSTDPWRLDSPAHDYLTPRAADLTTVVRYTGISGVTASSSWSDAQPIYGSRPAHQPFAALDGDQATSWQTAPLTPSVGQWLQIELARPQPVEEVALDFDLTAASVPTQVTVVAGVDVVSAESFGSGVVVRLPGTVPAKRIFVQIDAVVDVRQSGGGVGLTEIRIPGVEAGRTLKVPGVPAGAAGVAPTVVLTTAPAVPSCLFDEGRPRCAGGLARGSEDNGRLDRLVTLPGTGQTAYTPFVWARARPGAALNAVLDRGGTEPAVTASSVAVPDPAARPGVVVDGDPATTWSPSGDDKHPWLRLTFPAKRTVTGVRFTTEQSVAGARPWAVTVIGDDGVRGGVLAEDGALVFDQPLHTDDLSVMVTDTTPARTYDPYLNFWESLPIAVGELAALPASPIIPVDPTERIDLPCGSGPGLEVAGTTLRTRLSATRQELQELREVPAVVCPAGRAAPAGGWLLLPGGEITVAGTPTDLATPARIVLDPTPATAGSGAAQAEPVTTPVQVRSWSPAERRLEVRAHAVDRVLTMRENTNAGWEASIGGRRLTPVTLDGWQQGFVVPAGVEGTVVVRFASAGAYQGALIAGGVLLGGVLLLALLPARRAGVRPGRPVPPGDRVPATLPLSRRRGWLLAAGAGGVALVAFGGFAAIVLAMVAFAAGLVYWVLPTHLSGTDRRRLVRTVRTATRWTPVLCFAAAGWLTLRIGRDPLAATGAAAVAAQLFALAAVVALWLSVVLPNRRPSRPGPRFKNPPADPPEPLAAPDGHLAPARMNGRSTNA